MVFNLTIPSPNLFIVFISSIVFQLSHVKIEHVFPGDTGVDRPVSIPPKKSKEVESSYIVALLLNIFTPPPNASNNTKIAEFNKRMRKI
jgi:hypothetical protein